MDDELPVVWPGLLERPPECPERVRRTLAGARGDRLPGHRWAVINRLREAARTAHAELRAPQRHDFPPARDLEPEQQVVYDAGAAGYLALFHEPARALDVAADPVEQPELGARLAAGRDLVVETRDGTVELRRLQLSGREPRVDDALRHHLSLVAPRWSPAPDAVRVVVANVLTLAVAEATVDVAGGADAARAWLSVRHASLLEAAIGPARTGDHCLDCEHVWSCPSHRSEWKR